MVQHASLRKNESWEGRRGKVVVGTETREKERKAPGNDRHSEGKRRMRNNETKEEGWYADIMTYPSLTHSSQNRCHYRSPHRPLLWRQD